MASAKSVLEVSFRCFRKHDECDERLGRPYHAGGSYARALTATLAKLGDGMHRPLASGKPRWTPGEMRPAFHLFGLLWCIYLEWWPCRKSIFMNARVVSRRTLTSCLGRPVWGCRYRRTMRLYCHASSWSPRTGGHNTHRSLSCSYLTYLRWDQQSGISYTQTWGELQLGQATW
ncbi:uncharacterized protein EV422DRAFT_309936 [Fimicolochytrium jonesii]|uniref:uncharacterized protein n=1 Tax=Fimicolochytrium jonesii TaxID=1396493 RepID=UPI0022FF42E8|nr:uncharacterized protein EV422DRAFT_309936 [Fimicolochytrium jonesii]KAI8824168.1 hypothetical protein EV422DRAFT_309936 [Fimicolochytrium jonesii]